MRTGSSPKVSFIIATYNRCAALAHTLARVLDCGLDRADFEIIVVDNQSTDGAVDVARERANTVIALDCNMGSCAKALGVERARGRYVVFLDDDSFPRSGSVARMIRYFESQPRLGTAGFTVVLPNGEREGAALPNVFVGCGAGFRREALDRVDGLDASFFMQAEEYDLAFRLAQAGWEQRVFPDLLVEHAKTPTARRSDRTTFFDIRNNLRVIGRYLPGFAKSICRADTIERYRWLAEKDGNGGAFRRGLNAGRLWSTVENWTFRHWQMRDDVFEVFFCWELIENRMVELARKGVRRIVFADLGKNAYPFLRGARLAGLDVLAIGDDRFFAPDRCYRGVPILPLQQALSLAVDALIVANTGAVHASRTARRVADATSTPVINWFPEPELADLSAVHSSESASPTDETPAERLERSFWSNGRSVRGATADDPPPDRADHGILIEAAAVKGA